MTDNFYLFISIVTGLIVGSFLNVCIYRIPRGESIVSPPSHCPKCGSRVAARDLIPVFSYLFLKGRCRYCRERISPLYSLVEVITSLLFAAIYIQFGPNELLLKYLFLTAVLVVITFIDLEFYLIPDRIVLFALIAGLPLNLIARDLTIVSALSGMLSAGGFLLILAVVSRGGMGGGDIKLAAVIGFYLGWPNGFLALLFACMLAGIVGLALVLTRIKGRKDVIPFGPFIVAGTFISIFYGNYLLLWYLYNM